MKEKTLRWLATESGNLAGLSSVTHEELGDYCAAWLTPEQRASVEARLWEDDPVLASKICPPKISWLAWINGAWHVVAALPGRAVDDMLDALGRLAEGAASAGASAVLSVTRWDPSQSLEINGCQVQAAHVAMPAAEAQPPVEFQQALPTEPPISVIVTVAPGGSVAVEHGVWNISVKAASDFDPALDLRVRISLGDDPPLITESLPNDARKAVMLSMATAPGVHSGIAINFLWQDGGQTRSATIPVPVIEVCDHV